KLLPSPLSERYAGIFFPPIFHETLSLIGVCLFQLQKFEEAIDALNHALAIDNSQTVIYSTLSACLLATHKYDDALSCVEQALSAKPDDYIAWFNKGCALTAQAKYEEAIESFEKALKINPDFKFAASEMKKAKSAFQRQEKRRLKWEKEQAAKERGE